MYRGQTGISHQQKVKEEFHNWWLHLLTHIPHIALKGFSKPIEYHMSQDPDKSLNEESEAPKDVSQTTRMKQVEGDPTFFFYFLPKENVISLFVASTALSVSLTTSIILSRTTFKNWLSGISEKYYNMKWGGYKVSRIQKEGFKIVPYCAF